MVEDHGDDVDLAIGPVHVRTKWRRWLLWPLGIVCFAGLIYLLHDHIFPSTEAAVISKIEQRTTLLEQRYDTREEQMRMIVVELQSLSDRISDLRKDHRDLVIAVHGLQTEIRSSTRAGLWPISQRLTRTERRITAIEQRPCEVK